MYNLAQPENQKDLYQEYDTVDFKISFENKKILANSIRLLGNVSYSTLLTTNESVKLDSMVGAHCFIDEVLTSTVQQGLIESVSEYGRYVGMLCKATATADEMINSNYAAELKSPADVISADLLKGQQLVGAEVEEADFSIKPYFCLNQVEGDQAISYKKTGDITISLRLVRNQDTLYGPDFDSSVYQYSLSDLRLTYITVPDDGKAGKHVLRTKTCLQNTIDSTYMSLSSKVPAVCSGVSMSFLRSDRLGTDVYNHFQCMMVPNLESLQFLFNDSENSYITYEIRDNVEVLEKYLESFDDVEGNKAQLVKLSANKSYGVGLRFGSLIDLSNQKFTTIFNSAVDNTTPMTVFMYFHGVTQL